MNTTERTPPALTLHVAGPFPTEQEARDYLRRYARERNLTGSGGLYVEKGWGERYDVREAI